MMAATHAGIVPTDPVNSGNGQRQGYVHSIDGVPTVPHYALNRWADYQLDRKIQVVNPTGRIVPRVLSTTTASPGGDNVVFNVAGTNLADHTNDGQTVTTNPARFELRVCTHHNSRNFGGLYSVTPELPCTCESPIIGSWGGPGFAPVTCPVTAANPNGVCTYSALSATVDSTAADPTVGTITFDGGAIDAVMFKGEPILDSRVPLDGINPGSIPDGVEMDTILCGFTEPRRHLYDLYHPNDGLASVRVPFTEDGSPSGTTNGGAALPISPEDTLSTYLVRFRRACSNNQECVDRAGDADSDNGVDRRPALDRLRATLSTTCSAALGVCQVPEVEKRCGRSLYDFRSQKCCSDNEADGKIVYPRGHASFRSVNDASDLKLHDDADLGELLLDVGAVEEFPCPCTGDDGIDDVADFNGNTFDLGATVGCEKAGQKCCTFRQLLDVYQTQSPNVVGTQGSAATRRAIEINPDLGDIVALTEGVSREGTIQPVPLVDLDRYERYTVGGATLQSPRSPLRDEPGTLAQFSVAPNELGGPSNGPVTTAEVPNVNPAFNRPPLPLSSTEDALWTPDVVGKSRATQYDLTGGDIYTHGSTVFPYYFCYDAATQQCCDDGQVYNPQSHQCCPIGNVVPIEQPCVCSKDSHCVRPELEDSDPSYASRKCCMQTSPPSEALEEHMAFCNRYASVNLRFDELLRIQDESAFQFDGTDGLNRARYTDARFSSGISSAASARYMGRSGHVGGYGNDIPVGFYDEQTAAEFRFDIIDEFYGPFGNTNNQFGRAGTGIEANKRTYLKNAPFGTDDSGPLPSPSYGLGLGAQDEAFQHGLVGDSRGSVVNGYDRIVQQCPGTCIDPTYQLCCNGATCRGEYERCCNKTCCNKFSATCVKGKKPADEGWNHRAINTAFDDGTAEESDDLGRQGTAWSIIWGGPASHDGTRRSRDYGIGFASIFAVPDIATSPTTPGAGRATLYGSLTSAFQFYGNQQAAGVNTFWSGRNFRLEYDVCTAVEYLDPVRAFWVFVLPTFLLVTSVTGLFATVTFLLRIRTGYSPRYSAGETALVSVAFLELVFALFLFFSPQWKYGVLTVLTALYAMFSVGIRSRYAYQIMVVAQLVLVVYLVDPFGGNSFFNLNEQRSAVYGGSDANGLTWYASGTFNPATNGLWRAISANWPALDHRDTPNLFGVAPSQKTADDQYNNFFGATFKTPGQGAGYRESYCTNYYNYFQLDARLLDFKVDNPAEAFFGYCSRTWTVVLLVMSGFVILFALILLALAVIGGVQQMLEDKDVSLVSDPEHFVDAQKVDSDLQPYFAQQELAE